MKKFSLSLTEKSAYKLFDSLDHLPDARLRRDIFHQLEDQIAKREVMKNRLIFTSLRRRRLTKPLKGFVQVIK